MTARDRVKATIQRKTADTLPYSFDLTYMVQKGLSEHYNCDIANIHDVIGDNFKWVVPSQDPDFVAQHPDEHTITDEFGAIWRVDGFTLDVGDWGGLVSHPVSEPSLEGYNFPSAKNPGRFNHLNQAELEATNRYLICGIQGLFDLGWHVSGFEDFLSYMVSDDDYVKEVLDKALEFNLDIIAQMPSYLDGIRFGEDWGQQVGLMMGPKHWRNYLKPRLKEMYGAARKRGFDVAIHSCGDITELFPDLIEIGVQVVHPIQPEAMDVSFLKKEYGKDIIFYGGLGSQSTIPYGTVEECIEEAKQRVEILGSDGGYIFGPAGAIPTEAPTENVVALIEFAKNGYK